MSATGRGATRRAADYYPTPAWCVHRLLDAIGPIAGRVLEPAVGDGAILRALCDYGDGAVRHWTTIDIRPEAEADITGDFVAPLFPVLDTADSFDWAITNPPFSLAFEFAQECLARADRTALLLRLSWLASADRAEWLRYNTPSVYVLPNRPNFLKGEINPETGEPYGGDSADYAWFVWGHTLCSEVHILDTTPLGQR